MHALCRIAIAFALLLGVLAPPLVSAGDPGPPPDDAAARPAEVDWTHAQRYDVILSEFAFAPERIILRQGQPYTLRLENRGWFRHTFTAPEFFRTVAFRPGRAAGEVEQSGGGLSIAAGEVEEVSLVPLRAGTYALECTKPLHGVFGMTGSIVVQ